VARAGAGGGALRKRSPASTACDFHTNRLLRTCQIGEVDEPLAREAARLRSATGRAGTISAVDALVAAEAGAHRNAVVLTSDPVDLRALAKHTTVPISVVAV